MFKVFKRRESGCLGPCSPFAGQGGRQEGRQLKVKRRGLGRVLHQTTAFPLMFAHLPLAPPLALLPDAGGGGGGQGGCRTASPISLVQRALGPPSNVIWLFVQKAAGRTSPVLRNHGISLSNKQLGSREMGS